jgi:hypothetical protein
MVLEVKKTKIERPHPVKVFLLGQLMLKVEWARESEKE